jgi:hypothetical protein
MSIWKKKCTNLKEKAIALFPFAIVLYISFTQIIPRTNYAFLREKDPEKILRMTESRSALTPQLCCLKKELLESQYKVTVREKLIQDFTYHKISADWNEHARTKIIVNNNGKFIGYKIDGAFYPNYFTNPEITKMFIKAPNFATQNSSLHAIKITFPT